MSDKYRFVREHPGGIKEFHHNFDPHERRYVAPDGREFHATARASRKFAVFMCRIPGAKKPLSWRPKQYDESDGSFLIVDRDSGQSWKIKTLNDIERLVRSYNTKDNPK